MGPVLALDAWERMAVAVCRGLGRHGIEVGVAGHDPSTDYAAHSRHVARYHRVPDRTAAAAPYEEALHGIVEKHGYVAIVSCHDATLARLASIDLPAPTLSVLDTAWHTVQDKAALGELCERIGVAYPTTERIENVDDLPGIFERLGAPVFVKSAQSAVAFSDLVPFQRGAVFAETVVQAQDAAARLLENRLPVIAQARIAHAGKLNAVVLRHDGRSELRYAHRVLIEHPRSGGIGITLETIDPSRGDGAEAIGILEAICEQVGFEGIVQAEFYRGHDGKLYVVDVNPRLWGSIWFAERMGLRVVERCIRAALGLTRLEKFSYPVGRRFHVLNSEIRWVQAHPDRRKAAIELVRATRPWDIFEYVDPTDPKPNLKWTTHKLGEIRG